MLRLARILAAAAMMLTTSVASGSDVARQAEMALTYRPLLAPDGSFAAIDVTLRFRGAAEGVTDVDLPDSWGGFDTLYTQLSAIRVEGGTLSPPAGPARIEIRHAPGAQIILSYRVNGADRGERLKSGELVNEYRPIVQPGYFHLIGDAVVAKPAHLPGSTPARFSIENMPAGASFASDLEHGDLTFDKLVESIAVGGDFRLVDAGRGARLAIRGRFDTRDDLGWADSFRKVSGAMADYWNSDSGPYLVTVIAFGPAAPGATSIGGTGRGDAFAFFATTNAEPDILDTIMAHEMAHSWVNARIGGFARDIPEPEQYWLSEGFTDFSAWRAMVRGGIWSPERYFREFNAGLRELDQSPLHDRPNAEAAALHWSDENARRLAYLRGMIFAHRLDHEARIRGAGSARAILLAMQTDVRESPQGARLPAIAQLRRQAGKRAIAIDALIARHIDRGTPIDLAPDFLADCGALRTVERPKFHRGFDVAKTQSQGGILAGVVAGSPAWSAGMRDGMRIIRRTGGEPGDSEIPYTYEVDDDGVARTLSYLPRSDDIETVRLFELADLSQPATRRKCVAQLSR